MTTKLGKRYECADCGTVVLCVKAGTADLECCGRQNALRHLDADHALVHLALAVGAAGQSKSAKLVGRHLPRLVFAQARYEFVDVASVRKLQ